jgi:molecular chaperone GrpE
MVGDPLESGYRNPILPEECIQETQIVTDKKENPFEEPMEFDIESATETEIPEPDDLALARAEEELAKHREAMLRMQAEMDNLRKRLMRDLERSRKLALEKIMKDLLQVWDSLERGLEVTNGSATVEALKEGQGLTLKMLEKVMQDHDLQLIDPIGQAFDPEFHEAVTVMPSAEAEENTVIEVLQKGFRLHDRLIRPAMVIVSRKP